MIDHDKIATLLATGRRPNSRLAGLFSLTADGRLRAIEPYSDHLETTSRALNRGMSGLRRLLSAMAEPGFDPRSTAETARAAVSKETVGIVLEFPVMILGPNWNPDSEAVPRSMPRSVQPEFRVRAGKVPFARITSAVMVDGHRHHLVYKALLDRNDSWQYAPGQDTEELMYFAELATLAETLTKSRF